MDAPEISILREDDEETPPPEFSKFRLDKRLPTWGQGGTVGPGSIQGGQVPGDSDEEDEEEDQLIDDDEFAIVTETGRMDPTVRSHKRGAGRGRGKRGGTTGRRGRPGREPPDAAAMMSTFEVGKAEDHIHTHGTNTPHIMVPIMTGQSHAPQPEVLPVAEDWSTAPPPKPPRKKPGPKKGAAIAPRPRKHTSNITGNNTPGTATPLDDTASVDASQFLIPVTPSVPATPKSDHPPLPSHLPPVVPLDLILDPSTPVPSYPLPTRAFAVSQPPKIPTGYAPSHPLDKSPARKWTVMQREIRGIGGGRWFARTWVAPQTLPQQPDPETRPPTPPPVLLSQLDSLALIAAESSRLPDVNSAQVSGDGNGEGEEPREGGEEPGEGCAEVERELLDDEEMNKPGEVDLSSSRLPSIVSSSPPPLPQPSGDIDRDEDVEMVAVPG